MQQEREQWAEREKSMTEARASLEAELQETISSLQNEIEQREQLLIAKEEGESEQITGLREELEAAIASSAALLEKERSEWVQKEEEINQARGSLEEELRVASDRLDDLKKKAGASDKELEKQNHLLKEAQEEASRLGKLSEEKENQLAEFQETISSLRKDIIEQASTDAGAEERFSSLGGQLTDREQALASIKMDYAELKSSFERVQKKVEQAGQQISELESDKESRELEVQSGLEQIKQLRVELSKAQDEGRLSQEKLGPRVEELEKLLVEKDETIAAADKRAEEALASALAPKEEEISRIGSEYRATVESLKEQTKDAMRELARVREELEGQLTARANETHDLKAKLAQMEAEANRLREAEQTTESIPTEEVLTSIPAGDTPDVEDTTAALEAPPETAARESVPRDPVPWIYTFEDFIVSEGNSFSINMAKKTAQNPGDLYNPLCVYGPEGSGKTHLLHAIGSMSTSENPDLVHELTSTEELLKIIQGEDAAVDAWAEDLQLLIIDDFDMSFVSSETQARLCYYLRLLVDNSTQVIIASRVPPIGMGSLQDQLLRLLEGGLLSKVDVDPKVMEERKEAAEAIVSVMKMLAAIPKEEEKQPVEENTESAEVDEESDGDAKASGAELARDFLDEFLSSSPSLTAANFRGNRVFEEFEEAFKNPDTKRRNRFPLLVIESDSQRRNHFFHALANNLQNAFTGPVALLSIEKLSDMLGLTPSFDWSGLLNKLTNCSVVLVDDCDSILKLSASSSGYLQAIIEEISGRNILLMMGASKLNKKDPIFANVFKKASRKKI